MGATRLRNSDEWSNFGGNKRRKQVEPELSPAEATLCKWAAAASVELASVGWEKLVKQARGTSQLDDRVKWIPHKAGRLLDHLRRKGAAVPMRTAPWTHEQIMTAAKRGCHKSARDHTEFVCEELVDFCRQGYWTVLPLDAVQQWPELRLSPLGVVPQRERRPRLIVDYTFSGVNQDTARLAPAEAMQFGRALQRVLTQIVHADPRFGPPKLAKIDIADGFYRVWLWWRDIPKLGVLLPFSGNGGSTQLVAFPSALPMGWVESPPHFTTLTETACDLANAAMTHGGPMRAHRLEQAANTPPSANEDNTHATRPATIWKRSTPLGGASCQHTWASQNAHFGASRRPPVAVADVYVDDFLLTAQTRRQPSKPIVEGHAPRHRLRPTAFIRR